MPTAEEISNQSNELSNNIQSDLEKSLQSIQSTNKEIENNQNIIAVGYQEEVRPYFAMANVFVLPVGSKLILLVRFLLLVSAFE